jgi:hypothetical protein
MSILRPEDYGNIEELNENEKVLNLNDPVDIQLIRDSPHAQKIDELIKNFIDEITPEGHKFIGFLDLRTGVIKEQ